MCISKWENKIWSTGKGCRHLFHWEGHFPLEEVVISDGCRCLWVTMEEVPCGFSVFGLWPVLINGVRTSKTKEEWNTKLYLQKQILNFSPFHPVSSFPFTYFSYTSFHLKNTSRWEERQ